jgi:two-component system alkaline phosphatase synthesis response regulator PhoP
MERMAKRILVIDDQESMRSVATQMLGEKGHEIVTAGDGAEGWKIFEREGSTFNLVLADVNMPKLDGFELLKRIKTKSPKTPVILLTGTNEEMAQYFGKEFKADEVINKPFIVDEAVATIEKLLNR